MECKFLFTCLLLTLVNFGASVVIFTLSQTCFQLSALSPENFLAFHSVSCNILIEYKQQKPSKVPNDKPNSLTHISHIVPKL